MEGGEKSHKPGIGSVADVTRRHIGEGLRKTREKREEKRRVKRDLPPPSEDFSWELALSLLPAHLTSHDHLRALFALLARGADAEPHYDVLFPAGSARLGELVAVLGATRDLAVLRTATSCLVNISSHEELGKWSLRLIRECGLLPLAMQLLRACPDHEIRSNVVWIMANMCMDHAEIRDLILSQGLIDLLLAAGSARGEEETNQSFPILCYLFRALFRCSPLPHPVSLVEPLWMLLIRQHLLTREASEQSADDLLCGVERMVRGGDLEYIALVVRDGDFCRMLRPDVLVQARILASLSYQAQLVSPEVIPAYVAMLNVPDPNIRAQGGLGLCNMSSGRPDLLGALCTPYTLDTLQRTLHTTDVLQVRREVYWTLVEMIIAARTTGIHAQLYQEMARRRVVYHLVQILTMLGEHNLVERAIRAIDLMHAWNPAQVAQQMEEFDGLQHLQLLYTRLGSPAAQNAALELMEKLEGGGDW